MTYTVAGLNVSRETFDRLHAFVLLVEKWTPKINLIAASTLHQIWDRHVVDSAQIMNFLHKTPQNWLDIGSGGGFPGVVCAIIAQETHPGLTVTFVESDQRKATFLRTALRELGLPGEVKSVRIEALAPQNVDIISARALIAMSGLVPMVRTHLAQGGRAILHKGRSYAQELADIGELSGLSVKDHPSQTERDARIIVIEKEQI